MANNLFIYDYNNLLATSIGAKNGIDKKDLVEITDKINIAYNFVFENPSNNMKAVWESVENIDLDSIKQMANKIRKKCESFVVLGIGGSSLGSEAIFNALCHCHHNELPKARRNGAPRFYVEDNVDPEKLQGLFDIIDLGKTVFCVVSKSGNTIETLSQFFTIKNMVSDRLGGAWKERFVFLTDNNDGFLNRFVNENGLDKLYIPNDLGGRYSVLSAVGLLPAAVLGLNIDELIEGARLMVKCARVKEIWKNAPLLSAVFDYLNYKKGKNMAVMIPYSEALEYLDDWFCQLWAESLGRTKNDNKDGVQLIGQTPIKALGTSSQHSQFQLYLEGPDDKIFTFIGVQNFKTDIALSSDMNQLYGQNVTESRKFGDLFNIERIASTLALTSYKKPSETIIVSEVSERVLGKLFMFFMLKTAFMGSLLEINPFGQPAVESIKLAVSAILKSDTKIQGENKIEV